MTLSSLFVWARRTLADQELARLQAQLALARLSVAGEVRNAYWSVRLGEGSVDLARRRLQAARTLQADVERQVAAGQVAVADLLLAKGETLEAQSIVSEQEAALTEARLAFQALTGAPSAADFAEPEPAADRSFEQHPRLVALRTTVDVAEANTRLIRIQDRDNPEVALLADEPDVTGRLRFSARHGPLLRHQRPITAPYLPSFCSTASTRATSPLAYDQHRPPLRLVSGSMTPEAGRQPG